MFEEPDAEPFSKVRAFDEARNVGCDKRPVAFTSDNSQVWLGRGEWIRRDLRPRRGDAREKRGLAYVGATHDSYIGQHLEHEPQLSVLAVFSLLGVVGKRVGAGLELCVSAAARSAPGGAE